MFFYEFVIVILAMILGARYGGVFFGMCGGLGLLALILILVWRRPVPRLP